MTFLYNFIIQLYILAIRITSLFNHKARLWLKGRKKLFRQIENQLQGISEKTVWFHCSSLGEFEQGRPLIEAFSKKYPEYKIILTFFSPSGYEIRKNYDVADFVFYLPADTKKNARKFLQLLQPEMAFFVKYEFWYHYLKQLHKRQTPVYLISGIFRTNQLFFQWYGSWYKKMLHFFTWFFVQNQSSEQLLFSAGFKNVTESTSFLDSLNFDPDTRTAEIDAGVDFMLYYPIYNQFIFYFSNKTRYLDQFSDKDKNAVFF